MKLYCPNCYAVNEYTSRPGKFCSECGTPFSGSTASVRTQTAPPKNTSRIPKTSRNARQIEEEEYENEQEVEIDDDGEIIIPDIKELDVEIQGNLRPNVNSLNSLKNISGTNKSKNQKKLGRPSGKSKPLTKREIEQNWQKQFPQVRQSKDISE